MRLVWEILNLFLLNPHRRGKKIKLFTHAAAGNLFTSSPMKTYPPLISLPIKLEGGAKPNEIYKYNWIPFLYHLLVLFLDCLPTEVTWSVATQHNPKTQHPSRQHLLWCIQAEAKTTAGGAEADHPHLENETTDRRIKEFLFLRF